MEIILQSKIILQNGRPTSTFVFGDSRVSTHAYPMLTHRTHLYRDVYVGACLRCYK